MRPENYEFSNPSLTAYAKKYKPIQNANKEQVFNIAQDLLDFFATNRDTEFHLKNMGLNINVFSEALDYRLGGFDYFQFGFPRFVDFIRYTANKSKCKLIYKAPSEYRIALKTTQVSGFSDVSPITDIGELHTKENYNQLLSKNSPVFRLPNAEIIFTIVQYFTKTKQNTKISH